MDNLDTITSPKRFIKPLAHLPVMNLRLTLDYYRDKLGFSNEWMVGEKDGGIRRDDLRLLFEQNPDFVNNLNNEQHRLPIMWFVTNIDAIYLEFKNRDIPLADDLRTHSYGLREFAFIDINGYLIRIAEGTAGEQ
jgi:hypothetical protein